MMFDRFLSRLIGAETRRAVMPAASGRPALRGSGSWANEWMTAEHLAAPGRGRVARQRAAAPSERAFGAVRPRTLMETGMLRLHESLTDRIEAEAPTCTLHSAVAFGAFLVAEPLADGSDRLAGLFADLLVADGGGRPLVAVLKWDKLNIVRQEARVNALMDGAMPFVELSERPSHGDVWAEISAHLPRP